MEYPPEKLDNRRTSICDKRELRREFMLRPLELSKGGGSRREEKISSCPIKHKGGRSRDRLLTRHAGVYTGGFMISGCEVDTLLSPLL